MEANTAAGAAAEQPSVRIALRRRGFWTPLMAVIPLAAAAGGLLSWLQNGGGVLGLLLIAATVLLMTLVVLAVRALSRPRAGGQLEFHADGATLPLRAESRRTRTVAYDDILSADVYGKGRWARLLIMTTGRSFVYPLRAFAEPDRALAQVRAQITARIAAPELLAGMEARHALARSIMSKKPVATLALTGATAAMFAWQHWSGAFDRPFALVGYGANVPALVAEGEWYRLLTATFLHGGWLHIYLNAIGILVLGTILERLIGTWRLLLLYLTTAVAGAAASAWWAPAAMSVGASTAVFGLLGALATLNWRFRSQLPGGYRQPLKWWLLVLGVNAALPILVPVIDYAAHAGGLAAGVAAGWLLARDEERLGRPRTPSVLVKTATLAVVVLYAGALLHALEEAPGDPQQQLAVAAATVTASDARPSTLNSIAWSYAAHPAATPEELDLAARAAKRAVGLDPESDAIVDTLATVYYRQGRLDDAVATELEAVALDPRRFVLLQLGRFLAARAERSGPIERGGMGVADVALAVGPDEAGDGRVEVRLARSLPDGATAYALLRRSSRLVGIVQVLIGVGAPAGPHAHTVGRRWLAPPWPPDVRAEVVYVDGPGCACPPGRVDVRVAIMNRRVAELP